MAKRRKRRAVHSLALEMEEPLNQAIWLTEALALMGHGLVGTGQPQEGGAVAEIAGRVAEKLEELRSVWAQLTGSALPEDRF